MEATVVCVDNSEFTRNGDYHPNRFQAQADAINLLAGAKTGANPENTVGVLACATVAGKAPKVLVTPTPDLGKVLTAMSNVSIEGDVDLCKSAQIAQLALKHRQNKNQRQRIVLFVGSPVKDSKDVLVKVGKKLKKNNVSIDVVAFGDCTESNREHLEAFVAAVCKDDNSHYVEAPVGANLCDEIISSPVMVQGGGAVASAPGNDGAAAPAGGGFEFGVDPSVDPELALALRMSMEEEQARQRAAAEAAASAAATSGGEGDGAAATAAGSSAPAAGQAAALQPAAADAAAAQNGEDDVDMADEDTLLQQALAMSMQESAPSAAGQGDGTADAGQAPDSAMDVDDPELAAALAMSMVEAEPGTAGERAPDGSAETLAQNLEQSMAGLPGVDTNDPAVQAAIAAASKQSDSKTDTSEKDGEQE